MYIHSQGCVIRNISKVFAESRLTVMKRSEIAKLGRRNASAVQQTTRRRRVANEYRKGERHASLAKRRMIVDTRADVGVASDTSRSRDSFEYADQSGEDAAAEAMEAVKIIQMSSRNTDLSRGALFNATRSLSRVLSHPTDPPTAAVASSGVITILSHLLTEPHDELRIEVLRCLTNIAADVGECARSVMAALPHLISFVAGGNILLREQSCWILGNVAADSDDLRCDVLAAGALMPLASLLQTAINGSQAVSISTICTATWTIANLARPGKISSNVFFDGALPSSLLALLAHTDEHVAAEAAWALTFLLARDDAAAAALVKAGIVPALVQSLHRSGGCHPLVTPVLRSIGNIISINEAFAAIVLTDERLLGCIQSIFVRASNLQESHGLIKETIWVVANLAAGPAIHRQAVIRCGLLPALAHVLSAGQFDLRREALFAVHNLLADGEMATVFFNLNVLPACVSLLRTHDYETAMSAVAVLDVFLRYLPHGPKIIEEAGGLEALDELHYGDWPEDIRCATGKIVDEFYGEHYGESDDDTADTGNLTSNISFFPTQPNGTNDGGIQFPPPAGMGRGRQRILPSWMTAQTPPQETPGAFGPVGTSQGGRDN